MGGATLNRGKSEQVVRTPMEFIRTVEGRFGRIKWDLAATMDNQVTGGLYEGNFLGPGSGVGCEDSLTTYWPFGDGTMWLNPPFADIAPWACKCSNVASAPSWTLMLVPASEGTNWWSEFVHGIAMVYFLSPRITFVGSKDPYPKDLALCAYGFGAHGYTTWRWK